MDTEYPHLLHWDLTEPYLNALKPLKLNNPEFFILQMLDFINILLGKLTNSDKK